MQITGDVRRYAESAVAQGRTVVLQAGSTVHTATERLGTIIDGAPRPSHTALGVADVAMELITRRAEAATRRVEHLPASAAAGYDRAKATTRMRMTKGQEDAVAAIARAQEEAQARIAAVKARVPAGASQTTDASKADSLRHVAQSSFGWAKEALASVNDRGQVRSAGLSDRRVGKLMDDLDRAADTVQTRVRPALDAFSGRLDAILSQLSDAVDQAEMPVAGAAGAALDPVADLPPAVKVAPRKTRSNLNPADRSDVGGPVADKPAKKAARKAAPKPGPALAPKPDLSASD